jgi:hypothetical protein
MQKITITPYRFNDGFLYYEATIGENNLFGFSIMELLNSILTVYKIKAMIYLCNLIIKKAGFHHLHHRYLQNPIN